MKKTKNILIAPSILSADFSNLKKDILQVRKAGADWLHVDIMDGSFVPNLTIGPAVIKSIRPLTGMLFDVHLMIDRPDKYWKVFKDAGADLITFHCEAAVDKKSLIKKMKKAGLKVGMSLRPGTELSKITSFFKYIDLVLVMTVEPGFGGQKFMERMLPRIRHVRQILDFWNLGCYLEVDGGINPATAQSAVRMGADVLVAGNSVFGNGAPFRDFKVLRHRIDKASCFGV